MVKTLVITDDGALVEALSKCSIFQSEGARVDWHQRVRIDDPKLDDYELFVIDSHMEGVDGPALVSQILDSQPHALTLFVADSKEDELIVTALRAGSFDFITRPIRPDYLMASLKRFGEIIRFRELNRSKDELLAGIWHGLRTPLNTILNWAQLLRTESLDKSTAQLAVERIERGAREEAQLLERFEGLSLAVTASKAVEPSAKTQSLEKYLMDGEKMGLSRSQLLLQGLKILVVDDEADGRELLQIILSQSGAEVTTVGSAKEALAVFQQCVPDILVSDIGMPDQDGYALIRHVRNLETGSGGGVAALALTAYAGSDDYNRTVAAGFNGHLNKPVEPAKLLEAVAVLAGRVRGKQMNAKRF